MIKNASQNFDINLKDIHEMAPKMYSAVADYYSKMYKILGFLNLGKDYSDDIGKSSKDIFGFNINDETEYDSSFMKNENFHINVFYYLCVTKITNSNNITWGEYLILKKTLDSALMTLKDDNLSINTMLIKAFNANPSSLPLTCIQEAIRVDEFSKAVELIVSNVKDLKSFKDNYDNYESYFNYMREEAIRISDICHENGFFGTHDPDRFACSLIAQKMNIPNTDYLYNVQNMNNEFELSVDAIKIVQEQIIKTLYDNND